jgi:hypothetical protein
MRSALAVGLTILTFAAACGGDYGNSTYPATGGAVSSITVITNTSNVLTSAGDMRVVAAVVKSDGDQVIHSAPVVWRTSDPTIATLIPAGETATVIAVGDGTATITASSGGHEGSIGVTVRRRVAGITITAPDSALVVGASMQLSVFALDPKGNTITAVPTASYVSDLPETLSVSAQGVVTAIAGSPGPTIATVTATVTRDGVEYTASKLFKVIGATSASAR